LISFLRTNFISSEKTRSQLAHHEPVRENPTVSEIAADFPRHQETKRDPEKDERRNIDRRKRATPQFY
jgi:hypothetical protein